MIRGETIKYSSNKKNQTGLQEKKLELDIHNMEMIVTQHLQTCSEELLEELEEIKKELQRIRVEKMGVMIRSKSGYYDLGEKPTKLFF